MQITYLGHSSFCIKGKTGTVITDPYDSLMVGLKFPKHLTADVVTVSHNHQDHNAVSEIEGTPFVITGPGEYEVNTIGVVGESTYHDDTQGTARGRNVMYRIEVDGVAIGHLGDIGHMPSAQDLESLGNIDILMIPVGGTITIDAAAAHKLISEIDPKIVIPMHYGRPELNQKTFSDLQPLSVFLKEMGKEELVAQPKLLMTKEKLPLEMQVVVLQ